MPLFAVKVLRRRDLGPGQSPRLDETLRRLPRDVGLVLLSIGAVGIAIPGPVPPGTPFLLAGAVFACPSLARRFSGRFRARFPALYDGFHDQVRRFQSDLERRYPGSTRPGR